MKRIYSVMALFLILFVGTSCEDDYHDIVFFTGAEPIYQVGTCDNLISLVTVYLTKPSGTIVGIDGGDGNYSFTNTNETVATASFVKDDNGYQRLLILPKEKGGAVIEVRDGSGASARLVVTVEECMKQILEKYEENIVVTGDATDEQKNEIALAMADMFSVKPGGRYELLVGDEDSWEAGVLRIHPDSSAEPIVGTYERILADEQHAGGYIFSYNDEEHLLYLGRKEGPVTRMSVMEHLFLWEDVTDICPVAVPEGCTVYHGECLKFR